MSPRGSLQTPSAHSRRDHTARHRRAVQPATDESHGARPGRRQRAGGHGGHGARAQRGDRARVEQHQRLAGARVGRGTTPVTGRQPALRGLAGKEVTHLAARSRRPGRAWRGSRRRAGSRDTPWAASPTRRGDGRRTARAHDADRLRRAIALAARTRGLGRGSRASLSGRVRRYDRAHRAAPSVVAVVNRRPQLKLIAPSASPRGGGGDRRGARAVHARHGAQAALHRAAADPWARAALLECVGRRRRPQAPGRPPGATPSPGAGAPQELRVEPPGRQIPESHLPFCILVASVPVLLPAQGSYE